MKTLLSILIVSLSGFILTDANAYAQSNNSTVKYTPLQGSQLQVTLEQGQSINFPVKVRLPPDDKIINLWLLLSPWPDGIFGTINPQSLHNAYTANVTLQVYVQPYVKPGNYTLPIVAQGWINDTGTGKAFMVNSEPSTPLQVSIVSHKGGLSVLLGNMTDMKRKTYCYNNGCLSFTSVEKFQLLLGSHSNRMVTLGVPDAPAGKWIHFDKERVDVGPQGAEDNMTIAGMVQSLTGSNPASTKVFTIRAESQDGSTAQVYFPYEYNYNMSVLHYAAPINFTNQFVTNISRNNSAIYGVVYDQDNKSSIPVSLSVAGLEQDGHVVPLPPSIDVEIDPKSFILNASQVYYIPVMVKTSSAQAGNYHVAINETMGGKPFLSTLHFTVMPNICTGGPGMCGPQPTPQEKQARTHLDFPFDVTTDLSGNIYVVDSGNDRIVKFDPTGRYLMQFGISGRGHGQFMDPRGVAVDRSGDIYVADTINDRMEKFDPAGKFILEFGSLGTGDGQFHGPYSIAVDKLGFVYVADVGNARIQKFDPKGNFILKFGTRGQGDGQFDGIERIIPDNSGYLYITSTYQGVQKFDDEGNYVGRIPLKRTLGGNNTPDAWGIALDGNDNIYVAGYNQARIQKFDPQGKFEYEFGSFGSSAGQFNHPGNIAIDNSGNILVADSDNNRIERLDPTGKFLTEIHQWNLTSAGNIQKSPEFSLAVPVLLIGIASLIAFHRMKIRR